MSLDTYIKPRGTYANSIIGIDTNTLLKYFHLKSSADPVPR